MRRFWVHVLIPVTIAGSLAFLQRTGVAQTEEPIRPIPPKVGFDSDRAAIGERLFHDVRLSPGRQESCASCHPLDHGGMDGLPVAMRPDGSSHLRNTPTVFNAALNTTYNWDGVAHTLESHADRIIRKLMKISWNEVIARLRSDSDYTSAFRAFYKDGLTRANILDALATFERSIITPNCRFDRFLRGQQDTLTEREARGYQLFKRYGCITCHQGINVGGNLYQKFGVFKDMASHKAPIDLGRIRITNVPRDEEVFRVPSLRNVAVTAPYFHDGREPDLTKAVETMAKVQLGKALPHEHADLIVEFLRTLTGEFRGALLPACTMEVRP